MRVKGREAEKRDYEGKRKETKEEKQKRKRL